MVFKARYYSEGSASQATSVDIDRNQLRVDLHSKTQYFNWSEVECSELIGRLPLKISLPDGALIELPYSDELKKVLAVQMHKGRFLEWFERRWLISLLSIIVLPLSLWVVYLWLVPVIAAHVAGKIPVTLEQQLGERALEYLDNEYFSSSRLNDNEKKHVLNVWNHLKLSSSYQLEFRRSDTLGANALALPGGTIVLTDDLVRLLHKDGELVAVIGHEIGHIDGRHMTMNLMQSGVLALIINWVVGDIGGMVEFTLTVIPTALGQLAYSRGFEREADESAKNLLDAYGYSRGCLATGLLKIFDSTSVAGTVQLNDDETAGSSDSSEPELTNSGLGRYLSTHPDMEERIASIGHAECVTSKPVVSVE